MTHMMRGGSKCWMRLDGQAGRCGSCLMVMYGSSSFCDVVNYVLRSRASLATNAHLPLRTGAVAMNKHTSRCRLLVTTGIRRWGRMGTGWAGRDHWYRWRWYFLDIVGNPGRSILSVSRRRDRFRAHSSFVFVFKGLSMKIFGGW